MSEIASIRARAAVAGLELPAPGGPAGAYDLARCCRDQVHLSGHGPIQEGRPAYRGRIPSQLSPDDARAAARLTALNLLATIATFLDDDLARLAGLTTLTVFLNADAGFRDHPAIADAASELLVSVLGSRGRHSRAAVGVSSLPFDIPVEMTLSFLLTAEGTGTV